MDRRGGEAEQLANITDQNIQLNGPPIPKGLLFSPFTPKPADPEEGKPRSSPSP